MVPAPLIFLALGTVLLGSRLLPGIFGALALALGCLFAVAGLVGLFTSPILTLIPLGLQSLWVLGAAITLYFQSENITSASATQSQETVTA
jgi:hypothetical protein